MKNPRGHYLMELLMVAMWMFALGAQGSTSMGRVHAQIEFANPPPQQIVIAIVETPTFQIINEPTAYIQVDRGVSVPLRGLMIVNATQNYTNNESALISNNNNQFASDLGLRSVPQAFVNDTYLACRQIQTGLRGVNTRLDIGEI
jgi:hypothetical protein